MSPFWQDAGVRKEYPNRSWRSALLAAGTMWLGCTAVALAAPTVDVRMYGGIPVGIGDVYMLRGEVANNMDTEPAGNPYNDYVSEIKIRGIYSTSTPDIHSDDPHWGPGKYGYSSAILTDPVNKLWDITIGTVNSDSRISPGSVQYIYIYINLPTGISGGAIRYGAVSAQGGTSTHGYQPYPRPDTFIGPVGVEYPAPVVGLTVEAGQVRLGLAGLVVGREYRVMRSESLLSWDEVARFTVVEDPWPASGRVDREWSEAAVLPGRRFYRLEWTEP